MRRNTIATLLLVLALCLTLCACGGKKEEAKAVDLDALGAELTAGELFSDTMSQPAEGLAARLYGFNEADVARCVLYTGTGNTAEEIFLAEAVSADAAANLKAACETRVENQKQVFERYSPEDIAKLDDAVVAVQGNYVVLVVSGDSAAARQIVESALG